MDLGLPDLDPARLDPARLDPDGAVRERVALRCGEAVTGTLEILRRNGKPLSPDDRIVLDHIADFAAAGLAACTQREEPASRAEFADLLEMLTRAVCILDARHRIVTINDAALDLLGLRRQEAMGRQLFELAPMLGALDIAALSREARRRPGGPEWTPLSHDPERRLEARVAPMRNEIAVMLRDVTRERETEERLYQSQKLEAIGQLTGGIAHDVNNMLTVMLGNLEELAQRARARRASAPPAAAMENDPDIDLMLTAAALRAGDSAAELVAHLVAFARRQPLSPRVVDIAAMLVGLEALLRRTLGEQITLRIACAEDLWHALVDASELESAVLNLVLNAKDAMPEGGEVELAASNVEVDRVYAALSGLDRTGEFVVLSVADTGTGMTREISQRAFDPFFTTKEPGKGTGLGLSMVYGFARQSGGYVAIDSEPGAGTIVRIYLPRSTAPLEPHVAKPRDAQGGNETILLVEDNALVREHIVGMLRSLGYRVVSARDGREAIARLDAGMQPDLLVTDVLLQAGLTGRDVADICAATVPEIRVLFMSGYAGDVLLEDGKLPADVALLNKPFRRAELGAKVRAQLGAVPWAHTGATRSRSASA